VPPYGETQLYVRKGLTAYYGKATLGGGFGLPPNQTWVNVQVCRSGSRGTGKTAWS